MVGILYFVVLVLGYIFTWFELYSFFAYAQPMPQAGQAGTGAAAGTSPAATSVAAEGSGFPPWSALPTLSGALGCADTVVGTGKGAGSDDGAKSRVAAGVGAGRRASGAKTLTMSLEEVLSSRVYHDHHRVPQPLLHQGNVSVQAVSNPQ